MSLKITCKVGQVINIGDNISLRVEKITYGQEQKYDILTFSFKAPKNIPIWGEWRVKPKSKND